MTIVSMLLRGLNGLERTQERLKRLESLSGRPTCQPGSMAYNGQSKSAALRAA